ncbi:MAG: hypothetical protein SV253_06395 [Halobacteria archaeon]|nr:hypothetical protein [Halobacteria archaeon]
MSLPGRLRSQDNAVLITAVLVGLVGAYWFNTAFGFEGSFLLLLTLANSVPRAYSEYWVRYSSDTKAVAWTVGASVVAGAEFTGVYVAGVSLLSVSRLVASTGAFVAVHLGNYVWLRVLRNDGF